MKTLSRSLPLPDDIALQEICESLIEWISGAALPEERVGLREAAGNIGGMVVSLMLDQSIDFIAEESANVAELSAYFMGQASGPGHREVLGEIRFGSETARDTDANLSIRYA